ncbi:hypothetical protein SAMN06298216_1548 [Spirosomataceae bacterium TFI 002]|nr:hypothetical protein SAMN06298216_1548 [Spirosomataceae bacterium TFI 002]
MAPARAKYLMSNLLKNTISEEELNELLSTLGSDEMNEEYELVLQNYFNELLVENTAKKFCESNIQD